MSPVLPLIEIIAERPRAAVHNVVCSECGSQGCFDGYQAAMLKSQAHREDHRLERLTKLAESLQAPAERGCS